MRCEQLVLSRFASRDHETIWVGPLIAFVTITAYVALHKVARSLEDPFVHPPNDLPAQAMYACMYVCMCVCVHPENEPHAQAKPRTPSSPRL